MRSIVCSWVRPFLLVLFDQAEEVRGLLERKHAARLERAVVIGPRQDDAVEAALEADDRAAAG
jgi:hypothetical protein